jgi:hypothetical protein
MAKHMHLQVMKKKTETLQENQYFIVTANEVTLCGHQLREGSHARGVGAH